MKKYFYWFFCIILILINAYSLSQNTTAKKISAVKIIAETTEKSGIDEAVKKLKEIYPDTVKYSFSEREFNSLGYGLLSEKKYKDALAIFQMNIDMYPNSANVYDSFAEGYLLFGDKEKARENYKLAIEKDPNSWNAKIMLDNLDDIFDRYNEEQKIKYEPGKPAGLKGPYFGQKPPGVKPEIFAKGIISRALNGDYACTFSPDGKEFYFTRQSTTQNIFVSRWKEEGWTYPEPVTFSKGYAAHEPHITLDNKRMYWGWFRPPPDKEVQQGEQYGIYCSERTPDGWSEAKYAGTGMFVSSSRDGKVFITAFEKDKDFLAEATIKDNRFEHFEPLSYTKNNVKTIIRGAHPCIAPDSRYIVFDIEGGSHLCVSFKDKNGNWQEPIDLTNHGIDKEAGIASISPDGKYLFIGQKRDIYWLSTKFLEDIKNEVSK